MRPSVEGRAPSPFVPDDADSGGFIPLTPGLTGMSGADKLRPSRLIILAGLLGLVFLLLLVLVAARFGPLLVDLPPTVGSAVP